MKKAVTVIVFLILQIGAFTQEQLIVLHPSVGDTIDRNERNDFLLFPEITIPDFESATIHSKTDKFYLHVSSKSGLDIIEIDSTTIKQSREHIEKLLKYFAYLVKKETSLDEDVKLRENVPKFQGDILTAQQRETIAIEARKYFNVNQDAESLGLWGLEKENYIKVNSHSCLVEFILDIVK